METMLRIVDRSHTPEGSPDV